MIRPSLIVLVVASVMARGGAANAQPTGPTPTPTPTPVPTPTPAPTPTPVPTPTPTPTPTPPATPTPTAGACTQDLDCAAPTPSCVFSTCVAGPEPEPPPPPTPPPTPRAPRAIPNLPELLTSPTARLLPAGTIYSRSTVDTSGGLSQDLRIGLGDVAEFGVGTTDLVRASRTVVRVDTHRISPYFTATFRLGVNEDRLGKGVPGVVLGFRKSFEVEDEGVNTRIAELHLMMSKMLGEKLAIHIGGVFWDASMESGGTTVLLHDRGVKDTLRLQGGFEVRPLPDAEILIDLSWVPSFCYECAAPAEKIVLTPLLSWGVRYLIADWVHIEAGVRLPDVRNVNLLDAQIFGQVTFLSDGLRKAVDGIGKSKTVE